MLRTPAGQMESIKTLLGKRVYFHGRCGSRSEEIRNTKDDDNMTQNQGHKTFTDETEIMGKLK
jgi:hypothetical protein